MFKDEKSNIWIYADLDQSVIHATLRTQDLVPAFLNVIRDTPEYEAIMFQPNMSWELKVISDPTPYNDDDERWESEEISYFLNETLFDILNMYAPDGYYFGAHIGDGSDFGYWKVEEGWVHRCNKCHTYFKDETDIIYLKEGKPVVGCPVCETDDYIKEVYAPDLTTCDDCGNLIKPLNGGDCIQCNPFRLQGGYAISNACGYEVELANSGDAARLRIPSSSELWEVTDWLNIEYIEDKEYTESTDGEEELRAVIDPEGYNVPLDLVMRVDW